ncbi:MAG TPA: OmpA family protein [Spirochaetota bacterium]|nr:OmpA family protein [Spirochaetota bacterium]HPV41674.1 OmpA family protein [Spirochaetota bacterium]
MKKLVTAITIIIAAIFIVSCAKEQVKEPEKVGVDTNIVQVSNEQLAKYPVTGFAYKSSKVPPQSWDKWAKVAAPVVKGILDKLPEGYALEIRGHTDGRGPETAEGAKPGNMKISTDRAKAVYDSLGKAGITSPKLTYRGVGSSEPLSGADPKGAEQRRVTFQVVPK